MLPKLNPPKSSFLLEAFVLPPDSVNDLGADTSLPDTTSLTCCTGLAFGFASTFGSALGVGAAALNKDFYIYLVGGGGNTLVDIVNLNGNGSILATSIVLNDVFIDNDSYIEIDWKVAAAGTATVNVSVSYIILEA